MISVLKRWEAKGVGVLLAHMQKKYIRNVL